MIKEGDENENPQLFRRRSSRLAKDIAENNINISVPETPRSRKRFVTILSLSVGDRVFAKSSDRSFKEATFIRRAGNLFVVKFDNGQIVTVEGTKLKISPGWTPDLNQSNGGDFNHFDYPNSFDFQKTPKLRRSTRLSILNNTSTVKPKNEESITSDEMVSNYNHVPKQTNGHGSIEFDSEPVKTVETVDFTHVSQENGVEFVDINIDCACGIQESTLEVIKCFSCDKYQHVKCVDVSAQEHYCYICSKKLLNIDDIYFYNFFMHQHGMFPDPILNKLCAISPGKADIIRRFNKILNIANSNDISEEELNDLQAEVEINFKTPPLETMDTKSVHKHTDLLNCLRLTLNTLNS